MLAAEVARWFVWLVAFAWGAAWGSFFNVAIYRWPRGMSVVTPPSHCPSCGAPIRPWTNIPILGWLFKDKLKDDELEEVMIILTPRIDRGVNRELRLELPPAPPDTLRTPKKSRPR